MSASSGMLVCGLSCWPVVFELQQRMEVQSFPPGRCGVLALLVVAAGSSRRRIHSTCTGMGIRESSHAQLHHCLIGCRRRTVHVRIFDRQHGVLHVSPPPPAGIVSPSFHVKQDRWLLPRALDLHPRLVVDAYWMAITSSMASGVPSSASTPTWRMLP